MTPEQRKIIRKRVHFDTELYLDILNYFITESGHQAYKDLSLPENFPRPTFVEDKECANNTDREIDRDIETTIEGGTYYFSSAQMPSPDKSSLEDTEKFAMALFTGKKPTLLAVGGDYANMKEL